MRLKCPNFKTALISSVIALSAISCTQADTKPETISNQQSVAETNAIYRDLLDRALADPVQRSKLIAKVLGSQEKSERHAFLKFHVFGFAGDGNIVPFFTMNNYVIQDWEQVEDGEFSVEHREVAYYSKFDESEPLSSWENPFTGETVDLPHFVLGPVPRYYGPNPSDDLASFASDPLNITMIGDRVYIPTLSSFKFPNPMSPEEWGPYSNGSDVFWDSMIVYSAEAEDVFDPTKTHVDADIHMQNLVSWAPFVKMGQHPGRTMVRAYGQHISGFDELPEDIRKNFETYTPEIFDAGWEDLRMDSIELFQELSAKRANGTLDIDQENYVPFDVTIPSMK